MINTYLPIEGMTCLYLSIEGMDDHVPSMKGSHTLASFIKPSVQCRPKLG